MRGAIHPGLLVIHQTTLGSTKGQLERCRRRQKPVRQMLDSIPGTIRWGVGVRVHAGWAGAAPLWEFTQMGENVKTEPHRGRVGAPGGQSQQLHFLPLQKLPLPDQRVQRLL